jgi:hypothetical protein
MAALAMRDLRIGKIRYRVAGSDLEIVLAHALGSTFIELQQLEFSIISYLTALADNDSSIYDASFDVFASKTFGSLIREMERHEFLKSLAGDLMTVKKKRDFFVHKFLFHRYGGELTSDYEYEELIQDAISHGDLFAQTRKKFDDFMLQNAPLTMFAAKREPNTGELIIVESEFSKAGRAD